MASSEDVVVGKRSESAVNRIVDLAEEAKMASEGVEAPSHAAIFSICKSLAAGGIAGGVLVLYSSSFFWLIVVLFSTAYCFIICHFFLCVFLDVRV